MRRRPKSYSEEFSYPVIPFSKKQFSFYASPLDVVVLEDNDGIRADAAAGDAVDDDNDYGAAAAVDVVVAAVDDGAVVVVLAAGAASVVVPNISLLAVHSPQVEAERFR